MNKLNLQLFAEKPVEGKKIVYLFRPLSKEATVTGKTLAFTTENSRSKSKDSDSVATKDGVIRTSGAIEEEISATALIKKKDTLLADLEDTMDNDEVVEVWETNLDEPASDHGGNKFKGRYFQAYLNELEVSSNSEDYAEVSLTFAVIGTGKKGDVTVTPEEQAVADYVFKDTPTNPGK